MIPSAQKTWWWDLEPLAVAVCLGRGRRKPSQGGVPCLTGLVQLPRMEGTYNMPARHAIHVQLGELPGLETGCP